MKRKQDVRNAHKLIAAAREAIPRVRGKQERSKGTDSTLRIIAKGSLREARGTRDLGMSTGPTLPRVSRPARTKQRSVADIDQVRTGTIAARTIMLRDKDTNELRRCRIPERPKFSEVGIHSSVPHT